MHNHVDDRRAKYSRLATHLSHLDDSEVTSMIRARPATGGWGAHQTVRLAGHNVFVKRVPITAREAQRPFSTRNCYRLPSYYNYGVGSAGFGVFRELVSHIKTTNWVLEGAVETFPLLYHYRIVPVIRPAEPIEAERLSRYVRYWNGSRRIRAFITDRAAAELEAVLFLEHFPHTMDTWIGKHLDRLDHLVRQLWETVSFLRSRRIVHFDVHFANVMTDGERPYLTDFGLLLDSRFHLSDDEQTFLHRHMDYDYGELIWSVGAVMYYMLASLPARRRDALRRGGRMDTVTTMVENVDNIFADGRLGIDEAYVAAAHRYREVIELMSEFFTAMRSGPRKDVPFPSTRLHRLLRRIGPPTLEGPNLPTT